MLRTEYFDAAPIVCNNLVPFQDNLQGSMPL